MDYAQLKVGILYWGSRGGGKLLTNQLIDEANMLGINIHFFSRPLKKIKSPELIGVFSVWRWLRERNEVTARSVASGIEVMIIPMASPWDIFIGRRLMKRGIKVARIVHDATPHPGDYFPPKFWIRLLCIDSSRIVTLSEYVARRLVDLKYCDSKKIIVGRLPPIVSVRPFNKSEELPRRNFLFIGRGRTYKGLGLLLDAWPFVGDSKSTLTIAGQGHSLPQGTKRLRHIDRWLSDSEVFSLIQESDVIVLPYVEASQSGIIPIATAMNKPVVATPVGGLREQIRPGIDGIISEKVTAQSLVVALNAATSHIFSFNQKDENIQPSGLLIEKCILQF